jgi:hypothetical protein
MVRFFFYIIIFSTSVLHHEKFNILLPQGCECGEMAPGLYGALFENLKFKVLKKSENKSGDSQ